MQNEIKNNINSRVIIIQKLYGKLFNKDETISFPKHRFKKFIKDVVNGTIERDEVISDELLNLKKDYNLNKLDSKTRKFHSMINTKTKIDDAFGSNNTISEKAWIVKIINKNLVEVYLEKIKIFKKINVYHPKFSYLVNDCVIEAGDDVIFKVNLNVSDSDGNPIKYSFSINQQYNIDLCKVNETLPNKMISPFYLIDLI